MRFLLVNAMPATVPLNDVQITRWAAVVTLRKFWSCQRGGTAIEYALIAGTISMVIVSALISIGSSLVNFFSSVRDGFPS